MNQVEFSVDFFTGKVFDKTAEDGNVAYMFV